jgi:SAM-dependent methyltransferase
MKLLSIYVPVHSQNRMGHEGDVEGARAVYKNGKNRNLNRLLRSRSVWINQFISKEMNGVELGAGIGATKDFLASKSLILSDFSDGDWLDLKGVDALDTPFEDNSFDFVVASNMIHHVAYPLIFFRECERITKPGGLLVIQEIHTSVLMRSILRIMRHEGYNETINVFDSSAPCNDPTDPWSANCSVPKLLFASKKGFETHFPNWKIVHDKNVECISFLNSGGVVAKTHYVPLPQYLLIFIEKFDALLCRIAPNIFALQRQTVLMKKS